MASCRIVSALLGQSKTSTVAENWGTSVSEPSTSPARYSRETTSLSKGNTALGNAGAETRIRSRPSSVECQMAPTDRPKAANNPRTEAQRTLAPESPWQAAIRASQGTGVVLAAVSICEHAARTFGRRQNPNEKHVLEASGVGREMHVLVHFVNHFWVSIWGQESGPKIGTAGPDYRYAGNAFWARLRSRFWDRIPVLKSGPPCVNSVWRSRFRDRIPVPKLGPKKRFKKSTRAWISGPDFETGIRPKIGTANQPKSIPGTAKIWSLKASSEPGLGLELRREVAHTVKSEPTSLSASLLQPPRPTIMLLCQSLCELLCRSSLAVAGRRLQRKVLQGQGVSGLSFRLPTRPHLQVRKKLSSNKQSSSAEAKMPHLNDKESLKPGT